ncbi:MAG: hypothetical protein LM580_07915 [Thermofilum sp.]|nr:hypothetical protein [Thermofilum sp.]
MLLSIENLAGKPHVTVYGDFGFKREISVDFVLYGPDGKYSISEGVLEGVTAFEVIEMDGRELRKRGLPAEEGRKYRVLVVFRW